MPSQLSKIVIPLCSVVFVVGLSIFFGCSQVQKPVSEAEARSFLENNFVHLQEMEIVDARKLVTDTDVGLAMTVQFKLPPTQLPQDWMNYLLTAMTSKGMSMKEEVTNLFYYPENHGNCGYRLLGYFPSADLYVAEYRWCTSD